jgi:branched-chain amino acid transport system substrate-binding protein
MAVKKFVTRRQVLKAAGASAAVAGLSPLFGAPAIAAGKTFKIGYVSPQTGPLAAFGEADGFMLNIARKHFGKGVKDAAGKKVAVEILVRDSQSKENRAASVAADLIHKDKVDLLLVASTPETTNPVSDQAETNEVPCVSTMAPWQPWFFARGGKPGVGFKYTYHYFWGLEDIIGAYTAMWNTIPTNKIVGGLFPNDGDGNAWGDKEHGIGPGMAANGGYKVVDPGRFPDLNDNFSNYIGTFKKENVEIVTGVVIPPDIGTFLKQAAQQSYKPKAVTVGKALLFPVVIDGLGAAANNLSSEYWWGPPWPYKSSLTGESCQALCDAYTKATGRQWTQHIGFAYSLFEMAADIVKRSAGPGNAAATLNAIKSTNLETVVGPIKWGAPGAMNNVSKTPMVGGQWRATNGGKFKNEIIVVANTTAPQIPVAGKMELYG